MTVGGDYWIPAFAGMTNAKTWMAGTSPAMTEKILICPSKRQFLLLSTILRSAIHGIMARKRLPTSSIW